MINIDTSPIVEFTNMVEGFMEVLNSERTANKTVNAMAIIAATQFDLYADGMAKANPKRYHHVYEWGKLADPTGRLWDVVLSGSGAFRTLFYVFKPSRVPVPRLDISEDTRRPAIFTWKAEVMERGLPVEINRHAGTEYLAWPSAQYMAGANVDPMVFYPGDIVIEHPGGVETRGAFERLWNAYWAGTARQIIAADVVEVMEREFGIELRKTIDGIARTRKQMLSGFFISGKEYYAKGGKIVQHALDTITARARVRRDVISGQATGV